MKKLQITEIVKSVKDIYGQIAKPGNAGCGCAPSANCCGPSSESQAMSSSPGQDSAEDAVKESLSSETKTEQMSSKVLNVELLVIDLNVCKRCVPTGDQLRSSPLLLLGSHTPSTILSTGRTLVTTVSRTYLSECSRLFQGKYRGHQPKALCHQRSVPSTCNQTAKY